MKKLLSLLLMASLFACSDTKEEQDNDDLKTTEGHEQLQTPVQNSGAETEMDRALESIEQDTTGKQIITGKDSAQ